MPYLLEPKAELLTPEYWGVDIDNGENFATNPSSSVYPTVGDHRVASAQLAGVLARVVADGGTELKSHMRPEFDPSNIQLEDGSVVIIDQEQLIKRWDNRENIKPRDPRIPERLSDTPLITSPFVDFWRTNRDFILPGGCQHFGDEEAHFKDEDVYYGRHLTWGVLSTAKDGLRMICTWGISVPRCHPDGTVTLPTTSRTDLFRTATALPMEVGVTKTYKEWDFIDGLRQRHMYRATDIRVVHSAAARRGKAPRTIKERLAEIAASLTPQKQPGYIPSPVTA